MAAQRYYYSDTIADFLARGTNEIVGTLTLASHTSDYKPTRDNTYWLIHLEKPLEELKGKTFNKSLLLNHQEERGAYWIKKYEEAIKAFE